MAVAEMLKLNLAAMSYDRDGILNALQRSGAAEIKKHCETPSAHPLSTDSGELKIYLARVENALGVLSEEVDGNNKDNKIRICRVVFGVRGCGRFQSRRGRAYR